MATSVRLLPRRSDTMPAPTRPTIGERTDAPRMDAATMLGTPWSIAWEGRWKSGPECAAQHAKLVSAIAQMGQAPSTDPIDGAAAGRPPARGAGTGAGRSRTAQGITMSHAR